MKSILKLLAVATMTLSSSLTLSALEVGSEVEKFSANDDAGELWSIEEHLGKKNIVVYFYPAAMTGGCTTQACAYRDMSSELADADTIVVGVSGDSVNGLALFKQANQLNFPLLSDPNGSLAKLFGVPVRGGGSIEREVDGSLHTLIRGLTTSRWTYIIGKDGTIIYKNDEVKPGEDTANVLAALQANK